MKLSFTRHSLDRIERGAVILFVYKKKLLLTKNEALRDLAENYIKQSGFIGEPGQTAVIHTFGKVSPEQIILSGLGEASPLRAQTIERAASAAVRAGIKAGLRTFATETTLDAAQIPQNESILLIARGALWGSYHFDTLKTKPKKTLSLALRFSGTLTEPAACRQALNEAEAEGTALIHTADLANLPGNMATPDAIAAHAETMAKNCGLTCRILDKQELEKENCNALLSVAAGSEKDAKVIILEYKGSDPDSPPVALVGKTITFDSGGISLKPSKSMSWMLYDKCGGMAVLAAMQTVALLKPEKSVLGVLTVAENMPGGQASRPGDVITSRSGKTIEILNTDAEGRLALCDAIDLALEYKPSALIDVATLTGAVIVALGHHAAAVIGNRQELSQKLLCSAEKAGERLWELPLWDEHKEDVKGTFADLQNIGKSGTAGTITAAAFLSEFIPKNLPWAHLDIAGTAWEESEKAWAAPGATLSGARTLVQWIKGL
jgi:leucyl aminopeptidase